LGGEERAQFGLGRAAFSILKHENTHHYGYEAVIHAVAKLLFNVPSRNTFFWRFVAKIGTRWVFREERPEA